MEVMKLFVILVFLFSLISIPTLYFVERFSYAEEYLYCDRPNIKADSSLLIGIIGDSWVAGRKLDGLLLNYLNSNEISSRVISSGNPGARTKKIYENLFENDENSYSTKFIISEQPDYCVIIAGVNDAASQIGANNYSFHMIQIIKKLIHNGIKPVMVSLPEFGIVELLNSTTFPKRLRNKLSAYINNNNEYDNIVEYRKVLLENLISNRLIESILIVDFDKVCDDYTQNTDLYRDYSHLSEKGNEILAKEISNTIAEDVRDKLKDVFNIGN